MSAARRGWLLRWGIAAILSCSAILFLASAAAADPPKFLGAFGPDGSADSNFEGAGSVAVDQTTGNVYVLDTVAGALYKFDENGQAVDFTGTAGYISGNSITGLTGPTQHSGRGESQVAVDSASHTIYVTENESVRAFESNGEPAEFTAGPDAGGDELTGFDEVLGVTVDGNGAIYVSDFTGGVSVFSAAGEPIVDIPVEFPGNLAVAADGSLYIVQWSEAERLGQVSITVTKFSPSEFPVTATTTYAPASEPVDPHNTYTVAVDPVTGYVYVMILVPTNFGRSEVVVYDAAGEFKEIIGGPGSEEELRAHSSGIAVKGIGLELSKIYASSDDSNGSFSKALRFGPEIIVTGPPTVGSTYATDVSSDSATLNGEVNPNTFDTSYFFEYGKQDCAVGPCQTVPLGGGDIGSGHQFIQVSQDISGLESGTLYHYRLVAQNDEGTTEGEDLTLMTQASGLEFLLTDSRAWEMVSPPKKYAGALEGTRNGLIQASADGNGLAYVSFGAIEPEPDGNRVSEVSSVLARRMGGEWVSKDITAPNTRVMPWVGGHQNEYLLFSPILADALLEPRDGAELSPEASERTLYLRENGEPPKYTPLVTGKEGFANVPPGTQFGGDPTEAIGGITILGMTDDLAHIVVKSEAPLVVGASALASYLWEDGQLRVVSQLPADEGGAVLPSSQIGSGRGTIRNAISEDGSRVFWGSGSYDSSGNGLTALYMRDTVAEEAVRLDVPQPGASGAGVAHPVFLGASPDGSVVYFKDSQQLTEGASQTGWDLYRCQIPPGPSPAGCGSLSNLTAGLGEPGESAEVLGILPGISDSADAVYVVARGILDPAPNGEGEGAVSGVPNLYRWDQGEDMRFIASLSEDDEPVWGEIPSERGRDVGRTSQLSAITSPSGRYLTFMSALSLTGFDNRSAGSGQPAEEVFQYDAALDQLICISCNPTGARPIGAVGGTERVPIIDPREQWNKAIVSGAVPQPTVVFDSGFSVYQPRAAFDSGRAFFNSIDALVPADSNRNWDIYQFEPLGVGSCSGSSAGTALSHIPEGCVSLMSSGTGGEEAGFLDASASGDDVFFITPARLSPFDQDEELDVYDARVGGTTEQPAPQAECADASCRNPGNPPSQPPVSSEAFAGPGNVSGKKCPKGKKKVRSGGKTRCVKAKKHKRKQQHAKRAGTKSGGESR